MQIQGKYRCINCFNELNTEENICNCGYRQSSYKSLSHWLSPGTILDNRYYVGRVIGEGGFGITYIGYDENLSIKIAIKEFFLSGINARNTTISNDINIGLADKEELYRTYRDKFVNEAKALAKFNDEEGIVSVSNFFMSNNTAYIVMEFLEGETLKEYMKVKKKLSIDEMISIFLPMMATLGDVHSTNIIHRDISPDNIIVTKKGKVKLLDFGSAREVSDGEKSLSVVLKHGYAPFEQYQRRGKQGPWTDVYALSATMYECITGQKPIDALVRIMEEAELESVADIEPNCSKAISNVIMKGLSTKIENRYQTMTDMAADLKAAYGVGNTNEITVFANRLPENHNPKPQFTQKAEESKGPYAHLKNASEGDLVRFGDYKGHNTWLVLKKDDDEVMLLAYDIQERQALNQKNEDCDWSSCTLRIWMNNEYLNEAFNEEEKSMIKYHKGEESIDKVFLLSKYDAENVLKTKSDRKAKYDGYEWFWWIHPKISYNGTYYCASFVSHDGYVLEGICYEGSSRGGVRPVICIDISSL